MNYEGVLLHHINLPILTCLLVRPESNLNSACGHTKGICCHAVNWVELSSCYSSFSVCCETEMYLWGPLACELLDNCGSREARNCGY